MFNSCWNSRTPNVSGARGTCRSSPLRSGRWREPPQSRARASARPRAYKRPRCVGACGHCPSFRSVGREARVVVVGGLSTHGNLWEEEDGGPEEEAHRVRAVTSHVSQSNVIFMSGFFLEQLQLTVKKKKKKHTEISRILFHNTPS